MNWKKMAEGTNISISSCFFISVVLDGLQRLSGLFVLEILQLTNVSRQDAASPFIISWVVSNIVVSFSTFLNGNKHSEYLVIAGVLLCATGTAFCILATDVATLIVCWGLLFGFGYGLASPHLSRRLKSGSASNLSILLQTTPSIGVIIMSIVFNILLSNYALQGSYLIFCGIILNYLPLALAAVYKIPLPNIKWRVRKNNNQYLVSKQEGGKTFSVESFINSLEPDLILKINQSDEYQECQDEVIEDKNEYSLNVKFPVGRKRSETRCKDLQGLDMETRRSLRNRAPLSIAIETKNYEEGKKFEKSVVVHDEIEEMGLKTSSNINYDIISTVKQIEKDITNIEINSAVNLKNKILDKIPECVTNEFVAENNGLETNCCEHFTENDIDSVHTGDISVSTVLHISDKNTVDNILPTGERHENEKEISSSTELNQNSHNQTGECFGNERDASFKTENKKETNNHSSNSCDAKQTVKKDNLQLSRDLKNEPNLKANQPIIIKIHVEECTFVVDENWPKKLNYKPSEYTSNNSKNHSNSILRKELKNDQFFSKNFSNCSEIYKPKFSGIYFASKNSNHGKKAIFPEEKNYGEHINSNEIRDKRIFKVLNKMTSQASLILLLISVMFETNLVTLLTMFADFGNDMDSVSSDFKWILVAFGVGGFFGKICCCKLSKTIPDKYHAIGVVLFLLNGLCTAGVLYSKNLNWLACFYCILGALESGIAYTIPKLILEYIDCDMHLVLSSIKSFISGLGITCIPFVIGVFRDEIGDYEFLLQIMSCSSILSAFLAYSLPYLKTASHKQTMSFLRSKMEKI